METATRKNNRDAVRLSHKYRSNLAIEVDERRVTSHSRFHDGNRERTRKLQTIARRQQRAMKLAERG